MTKTIGFLGATTEAIWGKYKDAFERKLALLGQAGGHDVEVKYEWARGSKQAYTDIAQRFADASVNAIVTSGTEPVLAAAAVVRDSIPIFYASAGGPLPSSQSIIGTLNDQKDRGLARERFKILKKIYKRSGLPDPIIAVLGQFALPNVEAEKNNIVGQNGAGKENQIAVKEVNIQTPTVDAIKQAIEGLQGDVALLYICTDPTITTLQRDIIDTANRRALPTMFAFREYVENGGLLSFGADFTPMFVKAAENVHAYLSEPAALKGLKSTMAPQFVLVLNTHTETLIDAAIPPSVRRDAEKWPPGST